MPILRTPDSCFQNLEGFRFQPNYLEIEDPDFGSMRIHYLDEGPSDGPIVLCLHGEPTWCYLYRKLVPGCKDQPHITLKGRHFIHEEDGDSWARAVVKWMKANAQN